MRIVLLALLLTGCTMNLTDLPANKELDLPALIVTDREVYEARSGFELVAGDTSRYIELEIVATYTNRSDEPVYVMTYPDDRSGPVPPRIERLAGGTWTTVYDPPTVLNLVQQRFGPGETYSHRFQIRAYDRRAGVEPAWMGGRSDAEYRLDFGDLSVTRAMGSDAAAAPLAHRVSNRFRITGIPSWAVRD